MLRRTSKQQDSASVWTLANVKPLTSTIVGNGLSGIRLRTDVESSRLFARSERNCNAYLYTAKTTWPRRSDAR
jgi:hypothetical protein